MKKILFMLALGLTTVTTLQANWLETARELIKYSLWPRSGTDLVTKAAGVAAWTYYRQQVSNSPLSIRLTTIPYGLLAYAGAKMAAGEDFASCPKDYGPFSIIPWELQGPRSSTNMPVPEEAQVLLKQYLTEHNLMPDYMHVQFAVEFSCDQAPYAFYEKETDTVYLIISQEAYGLLQTDFDEYIKQYGKDVQRAALHAKQHHHQKMLLLSKSVRIADRLAGVALLAVPCVVSGYKDSPVHLWTLLTAGVATAFVGRILSYRALGRTYFEYQKNSIEKELAQLQKD